MEDLAEKIVKRDDIRAETPEPLNEKLAYRLGVSLARYLKNKEEKIDEVFVGYDMRLTSPSLAEALIGGIYSQGLAVGRLGECSTEMVSYMAGEKETLAVMVTASHNPKEYNGFKIFQKGAKPIGKEALKEIVKEAEGLPNPETIINSRESRYAMDIDGYVKKVLSTSGIPKEGYGKEIPVVIEAGNGMGGRVFQYVSSELRWLRPIYYHDTPDGSIPSGIMPNPLDPAYLQRLIKETANHKDSLLGICFDGDADRASFVYRTEKGSVQPLNPSQVGALIAERILRQKVGKSKILYNLVCSDLVPELVTKLGGVPVMAPVGYGKIRERMLLPENSDCLFALEHSGHYCYRDFYAADSAMITSLIVLDTVACLASQKKNLSSIVSSWRARFFQSNEINFDFSDPDEKQEHIERISRKMEEEGLYLIKEYSPGDPIDIKRIIKYRGLLFEESPCPGYWWFCLRPSENEPTKLRLMVEIILNEEIPESERLAKGPKVLAKKIDQIVSFLRF